MSDLLNLVIVKHQGSDKPYLFQAPSLSFLNPGTKVLCATRYGEQIGTVVARLCYIKDSNEYNFALALAGVKEPLAKIIGRFDPLVYPTAPYTNRDKVIDLLRSEGVNVPDNISDSMLRETLCRSRRCSECVAPNLVKGNSNNNEPCSKVFNDWLRQPAEEATAEETYGDVTDDLPF